MHTALRYLCVYTDVVAGLEVDGGFLSQVVVIHAFGGFIIFGYIESYYVFVILINLNELLEIRNMTPEFSLAAI